MSLTRRYRFILFASSVLALFSFYVFSREVKRGFLKQTDFNTTVRVQDEIDRSTRLRLAAFVDNVFEGSTVLASPQVSIVFVGLLTIAAIYDCLPAGEAGKKSAKRSAFGRKRFRWRALVIPILFAMLTLGEIYGKSVVTHPAPPFFMIKHPTTIFPQFYVNESYSYPSGHTARATFLGIVFLSVVAGHLPFARKNLKKWLALAGIVLLYVLIVATGKIYLGEHWLSDIIGGGLLGSGLGVFVFTFL